MTTQEQAIREQLQQAVAAAGLSCHEMGSQWHFRITGGVVAVNYYPFSKRSMAYVDGAYSGKQKATVADVIALAQTPLPPKATLPKFRVKQEQPAAETTASVAVPPWE